MIRSYWIFQPTKRENSFETPSQYTYPLTFPFALKMDDGRLFPYPSETIEYIFINVKNIRYPFLAIWFWDSDWGKYLYPTPLMLQQIVEIIGIKAVQAFWEWHNQCLSKHLELLAQGEIFCTDIYKSTYDICQKIGFPFDTYYYYKLLLFYGNSLFWRGNYSIEKQLKRDSDYAGALNTLLRTGKQPPYSIDIGQIQEKWLSKITDYMRAKSVIELYRKDLELVHQEQDIQQLINKRDQEKREFKEKVKESNENTISRPSAICQFCGTFIEQVTRFPRSCGSAKCESLYSASRKAKSRNSLMKSDLQVSKRGNGIRCPGCGDSKRVLYDEGLCKKCIEETDLS